MNKILIHILALLLVPGLKGQTYKPMLVNGNSWNVLYTQQYYTFKCGNSYPANTYQKETEVVKISGDTILAGKTYKKVFSSFDTLVLYWELRGFSREDTTDQKVYFTYGRDFDVEQVLYDFRLNTNDSIFIPYTLIVESIDSVMFGSAYTKRINFINGNHWIEGVGDLKGPFEAIYPITTCGTPPNTNLLCVFNYDSLIYKNTSTGLEKCSYWELLGVGFESQIAQLDYEIYPNPVVSYLRIHANNQEYFKIELIDLHGILVISKSHVYKDALLNIQNLQPGIYFARISTLNKVITYKVFKN